MRMTPADRFLLQTHIVTFDADRKIVQIRLQWDQGSLLKQIEIIGRSGRNWPIRDSREQLKMIQSCIKSSGGASAPPTQNETTIRTRGDSTNALRDPHASLHLTGSREEIEAASAEKIVSPYAGRNNRPQQRSFTDILGDEPAQPTSPSAARQHRAMSPSKGGSKNFQPMRLFDGQEPSEDDTPRGKQEQYIRPNPTKYDHFDFADGSDPQDGPKAGVSFDEKPKSKHDSQWSFNDFTTPAKHHPSKVVRTQDSRHWDTDRENMEQTPAHAPGKGRRDAETHFELQDDGENVAGVNRPGRPRGAAQNEGLGLYKNNVTANEAASSASDPDRPLGNITNLGNRGNDFDPHFAMVDASPSQTPSHNPVPETKKKAIKMMDSNWSAYDESPKQKENTRKPNSDVLEHNRINIAGDGMGGRKGTDRDWLYGGESEDHERINIAGDGMGGRKGTERNWLYGDTEEQAPQPTGRKGGAKAPASSGRPWDF